MRRACPWNIWDTVRFPWVHSLLSCASFAQSKIRWCFCAPGCLGERWRLELEAVGRLEARSPSPGELQAYEAHSVRPPQGCWQDPWPVPRHCEAERTFPTCVRSLFSASRTRHFLHEACSLLVVMGAAGVVCVPAPCPCPGP